MSTDDVLASIDRAVAGYTNRISYDDAVSDDAMHWQPDPDPVKDPDDLASRAYYILLRDEIADFATGVPLLEWHRSPFTHLFDAAVHRAAEAIAAAALRQVGPLRPPLDRSVLPQPSWRNPRPHVGYTVHRERGTRTATPGRFVPWYLDRPVDTVLAEAARTRPRPTPQTGDALLGPLRADTYRGDLSFRSLFRPGVWTFTAEWRMGFTVNRPGSFTGIIGGGFV